jgi:putative membrane protein
MRRLPFAAGCLILAACGPQPQGPEAAAALADRAASGPIVSALAPTPTPQKSAQDFVAKAAGSDAFELAAAREAMQRASRNDVKAFADMMLRDHAKSTVDLQKALASAGEPLSAPKAPPANLQSKLAQLGQTQPAAFDRAYMESQVGAHAAAVALLQDYAQNGDNVALKAFAAETLPVVQGHYRAAKQLHDSLPSPAHSEPGGDDAGAPLS